ncbi:MAG: hypothetical protein ACPGC0_06265, partial [Opitutales bacterium]
MELAEREGIAARQAGTCPARELPCGVASPGVTRAWLHVGIAAVFAGQSMVLSLALNMTPPVFGST